MMNFTQLLNDLNEQLPKNGWPLKYSLEFGFTRTCAAIWRKNRSVDRGPNDEPEIGLQIYERRERPILILFETRNCYGQAEPEDPSAGGIIAALNDLKFMLEEN